MACFGERGRTEGNGNGVKKLTDKDESKRQGV